MVLGHYYQQQQPFVRIGFEQNSTYEAGKGFVKCLYQPLEHATFFIIHSY